MGWNQAQAAPTLHKRTFASYVEQLLKLSNIETDDMGRGISLSSEAVVEAVMEAAKRSGLLQRKTGRIAGRVSPTLVKKAKARTGIDADTDLIEFALANIALEDKFAATFKASRGKVDPDLDLSF